MLWCFVLESGCKVKHFSSNTNEMMKKNAWMSDFFLKNGEMWRLWA